MWGGVKARKDYSHHFSRWTPTKGLEVLRKALAYEPRPWHLAFSLHRHNNLLQDHHCARLLSWCATIVQLRDTLSAKKEAYRYAHETFNLLNHSHKPGKESFLELMRLCAVGKDLTSAFEWHQHWIETKKKGHESLLHLVWLLRIAILSPSDESAEDMVSAVVEAYSFHFCTPMEDGGSGEKKLAHFEPQSHEEETQLRGLFSAFKALRSRIQEQRLVDFIDTLPVAEEEAQTWVDSGWPSKSHHHVFPHLEGGWKAPKISLREPRLRDSILDPLLIQKLEVAAFSHDIRAVVKLLEQYQQRVSGEGSTPAGEENCVPRAGKLEIWRQFSDPSARHFREAVVAGGGLTPELYHYLVVALASVQPTAALRTLVRMRQAGLRVLDLTRAVVLTASDGDFEEQLALFTEQRDAVAARKKLDEDFDITKQVEHYWKYEYSDFFYYVNALDLQTFYGLLMQSGHGGPKLVQTLLLAAQVYGPGVAEEDLVVLDADLRVGAASYFRTQTGSQDVNIALDFITNSMPKLDISLLDSLPHFSGYALEEQDSIATEAISLKANLFGRDDVSCIYVLDASFVETGESFLKLGLPDKERGNDSGEKSLILIPYVTLEQLATSIANTSRVVSFDSALQEAIQGEPFLASQRLRALNALLPHTAGDVREGRGTPFRRARVLHFTECLQAHGILSMAQLAELKLNPSESDDDHLILVLAMLCTLAPSSTRVVLCTDDQAITGKLKRVSPLLFSHNVEVLSTETPEAVVDVNEGIINDTPSIDFTLEEFVPKCGKTDVLGAAESLPKSTSVDLAPFVPATRSAASVVGGLPAATAPQEESEEGGASFPAPSEPTTGPDSADGWASPWLAMLQEPPQEHGDAQESNTEQAEVGAAENAVVDAPQREEREVQHPGMGYEALMGLYPSPNDVIPVGVKVQEADALGSIFEQFDVTEPDALALREEEAKARKSQLTMGGSHENGKRRRRRLALEREALESRGASNKERYQLARQLSNQSGGRVPFNFRYRIVEANILDPRNAPLRKSYEEALQKKREAFKKNRV